MIDFEFIISAGSEIKHGRPVPRLSIDDCRLLYDTVLDYKCKIIVEIGAMLGTSSMVLGLAARQVEGRVFSIEIKPRKEWFENITDCGLQDTVELIQGDSKNVKHDLFPHIDFLFIDGDHQIQSALNDYLRWEPVVRKGGLIAFHDIYGPPSAKVNKAIEMILEDDGCNLVEVAKCPVSKDCGTIVFEKLE